MIGAAASVLAAAPANYYNSLDGKSGSALTDAIRLLSENHTVVTYSTKTWPAFEKTDVRELRGRMIWWDMYSNNLVYTENNGEMEHGSLNIEHSVANSWWGGKNGSNTAYSDLILLNPSDAVANGKKNDLPPGEVTDARILDNGLMKIGTPKSGQGGGASSVFEPADEYKGDFARAYFYVFATYNDLSTWKAETRYVYDSGCNLQPWAVEMLLRWHREDPVDSKEINRNEEIYALQNNRNPFIDYPILAEYVWGTLKGSNFSLSSASEATAIDRPAAPEFANAVLTGVDTYSARWWDGFTQKVTHTEGTLMLSLDGRSYYPSSNGEMEFDPASPNESHTVKAYVEAQVNGLTLRSPIATLSLLARDPSKTEYTTARWTKQTVGETPDLTDGKWVIISSNSYHAMSSVGGTTSTKYLENGGLVDFDSEGRIVQLPLDAAVVEFESVSSGKYRLKVNDVFGNYKGSWNASGKNAMTLNANTYTPGSFSAIDLGDSFRFVFDQNGSLQFNKTQVRFVNYESTQTPVYLYRFLDMEGGTTGIGSIGDDDWAVGIEGNDIIAPEGTVIYDLNGRRMEGRNLGPGIYIVKGAGKSVKILL